VLVELGAVEQRHQTVLELLDEDVPVTGRLWNESQAVTSTGAARRGPFPFRRCSTI
jgi:hypothetical protein